MLTASLCCFHNPKTLNHLQNATFLTQGSLVCRTVPHSLTLCTETDWTQCTAETELTWPNTTCFMSSQGVLASVRKNLQGRSTVKASQEGFNSLMNSSRTKKY